MKALSLRAWRRCRCGHGGAAAAGMEAQPLRAWRRMRELPLRAWRRCRWGWRGSEIHRTSGFVHAVRRWDGCLGPARRACSSLGVPPRGRGRARAVALPRLGSRARRGPARWTRCAVTPEVTARTTPPPGHGGGGTMGGRAAAARPETHGHGGGDVPSSHFGHELLRGGSTSRWVKALRANRGDRSAAG